MAASWLFDLDTLEGLLLGSIIAATDGAAIFALLRGSTLRRRLARTLEGEAGFNDPVAVLLVIGFIDWIEKPDYGVARHGASCSSRRWASARWWASRVGWLAVQGAAAHAARSPGLYPVASLATAGDRLRRRADACTAPASSPSTWPGSCSARRGSRPSRR